ncbi:MAG: malate/lactate/ureidoglycolate dehydrogenase [Ancalomicrobiaceae bacterium]|nr:malate/lactate/ureidoglycolate dehydrogenase [Ancalomicrobiaceae bacterium]
MNFVSKRPDELRAFAGAILAAAGSAPEEAAIVADHLVEANLTGHDSHGVGLLPMYVQDRLDGKVRANGHAELIKQDGPIAIFDADMAFGHVVAREVTDWGIAQAKATGLTMIGLRNAYHVARLGSYAEQAFEAGLVSILFVNVVFGAPRVAPFGGADGRLHTNPICIGVPGSDSHLPFLLDFATSRIAIGKVRVAFEEGRMLPDGVLLDGHGRPANDPGVLFSAPFGAILPFGEHKGYGLAVACELLAGALTGGVVNRSANPGNRALTNSVLAIFVDPSRFGELPVFHATVTDIIAHLKAAPALAGGSGVLIAGDPERQSRARRSADGIPMGQTTWEQICTAGARVGVDTAP